MFKAVILASAFTSAAWAQSSPLIPSGISSGCSSFLTTFNDDTTLSACTAPLIAATAAYGPGSNSTTSPSAASITSTLGTVCASNTACPESTIRSKLADFYTACTAELTSSPNKDVIRTYDVLYTLAPFKTAICAKDDSGAYCLTKVSSTVTNSTSGASGASGAKNAAAATGNVAGMSTSQIQKYLYTSTDNAKRAEAALYPNTTTFGSTNLVFLFLQSDLAKDALCTTCSRNVVTSYITWESNIPYAPGLGASMLLSGQQKLYQGIVATCGSNFLGGAVQAAGGLSGGTLGDTNGALGSTGVEFKGILAAVMAVSAAAFALAA